MTDSPSPQKPLKTWSHLSGNRRRPSEYEVVSTRLHYHQLDPEKPWELDPDIPMADVQISNARIWRSMALTPSGKVRRR